MADYDKLIRVYDRYTPTSWDRKIGDGPWIAQDLTPYNGLAPVVFMPNCMIPYFTETLITPQEAHYRITFCANGRC